MSNELELLGKPFKIYAEVLEEGAYDQFVDAMKQDFVISGALMPDAHQGYSLPIGGVVKTDRHVVPSWVGYDIGCGMCALRIGEFDSLGVRALAETIFKRIYEEVPVGFSKNETEISFPLRGLTEQGKEIVTAKEYQRALGSLGGGNHFIEVGEDNDGDIWIVVHSGSRGVGHALATHYMKTAHPEGKAKEGHYGFALESLEGQNYMKDQNWALDFAEANRREIVTRVANVIADELGLSNFIPNFDDLINRNHNHAVIDSSNPDHVIHRKGATHAEKGMRGVIPGNMRDGSFIVEGLGNEESLNSSSHGAGRVLGRKEAKRVLNMEDFTKTMCDVTARVENATLDEAPFAYKNIFEVMELQTDLVKIHNRVRPIINIKG